MNRKIDIKALSTLADDGDVDAQYNMAYCFSYGVGVEQNIKQAAYWLSEAAKQGDSGANAAIAALNAGKLPVIEYRD